MHKQNVGKLYGMGILLYKLLLDLVFVYFIAPKYSYYMNLKLEMDPRRVLISYVLTLLMLLITFDNHKRLTNILLNVQLLITLIPMLSLYALSGREPAFIYMTCFVHILQCIFVKAVHTLQQKREYIFMKRSGSWLILALTLLLGLSLSYTFLKYGFASMDAFDLTEVYKLRENISYGFPFSYLIPWTFKIVCIFIFLISLEKKQYLGMLLSSAAQLYFYLIYANKQTLFSWLLVIACYILVKKADIVLGMIYGLSALLAGTSLIYKATNSIILLSYLVRRALFVPAAIKFAYYDFFSENELLHFADNSIGHLLGIPSPYGTEAPKLIADFLHVPDSYCNCGYWGDAYANFGMLGLFLFSILLALFLLLIEKMVEKDIPRSVYVPFLIALFYTLNDSALLTWCLGGGGGLSILLLWMYRNYMKNRYKYEELQKNNH